VEVDEKEHIKEKGNIKEKGHIKRGGEQIESNFLNYFRL
jgi:hypothetical protein